MRPRAVKRAMRQTDSRKVALGQMRASEFSLLSPIPAPYPDAPIDLDHVNRKMEIHAVDEARELQADDSLLWMILIELARYPQRSLQGIPERYAVALSRYVEIHHDGGLIVNGRGVRIVAAWKAESSKDDYLNRSHRQATESWVDGDAMSGPSTWIDKSNAASSKTPNLDLNGS